MKQAVTRKIEERSTELAIVIVALLVIGAAAQTTGNSDLLGASSSNGALAAEYRFDTGAGQAAYDTAGNNDGDINGAEWTEGVEDNALRFSSDDSVSAPLDIDTSELTLSFWMKEEGTTNDWSDYINIHGDSSRITPEYYENSIHMVIRQDGNNYDAPSIDIDNGWNHYALVLSSSGGYKRTYKNGELVGENQDWPGFTATGIDIGSGTNSVIDEVQVHTRALNLSQIRSAYNKGSWRVGLEKHEDSSKVLDLSFEHQNSTRIYDTSKENNHGQPQNDASQETAVNCKVGRCYSFDGNNDYIETGFEHPEETVTFMSWYKFEDENKDSITGVRQGTDDAYFQLGMRNGEVYSALGDTESQDGDVPINEWVHLAISGDGDTYKVYKNGQLVGHHNYSYGSHHSYHELYPGVVRTGSTGLTDFVRGKMDQVKVFNRSLSQQEIVENTEGLSSNGAVLDMRFDGAGGDRVKDHSDKNNHGTLEPNASAGPKWDEGVTGNALDFDGQDDYVDIPNTESLEISEEITVSAWLKLDSSEGTGWSSIVGKDPFQNDYLMWVEDGKKEVRGLVYVDGDRYDVGTSDSSDYLDLGKWYHAAYTRAKDGSMRIYINGEEVGSSTTPPGPINTSSDELRITGQGDGGWLNGSVDDVKIYPYAAPEDKIKELYSRGNSHIDSDSNSDNILQKDLVLSQTFDRIEECGQPDTVSCPDGISGETAIDESEEANHGQLVNEPVEANAASCKSGRCLDFDGVDDYVSMSGGEAYNFTDMSYTLSAWVKTGEGEGTIIAQSDAVSGLLDGYALSLGVGAGDNPNEGEVVFQHRNSNTGNDDKLWADGISINDGEWHHVVAVSDGGYPNTSIYIDGKKQSTNYFRNDGVNTIAPASYDINIGGKEGESSFLDGSIDEAIIYDRSLSKTEIWRLYTKGRDRLEDDEIGRPAAEYRMDAGPRICILNQDGGLSDGGWGGPTDSELMNSLESEGWNPRYVQAGDITQDGWKSCDVIIFPNSERYPAFDKSSDFCSTVNGEGTEHDVYAEMKEFMRNGGMWVGSWGAGLWYGEAWDGSSWVDYTSCSQYSGDPLYGDGGQDRCSDLGYSCYSSGNVDYSNIDQSTLPALRSGPITDAGKNNRWASDLDVNLLQAYNSSSGSTISGKYVGLSKVGDGWYFHPGGNYIFNPSSYGNASRAWNNLLTWYAGGGGQNFWDTEGDNTGTISGNGNDPVYTSGKKEGALELDGEDDVVEIPHDSSLEVSGTGELTISGWVRLRDHSKDNWERLLEKGGYGSGGYSIQRDNPTSDPEADKRLRFFFANSNGWEESMDIVQPSSNTLNEWHFFTVTVDDGEVTTYFDGKQTNRVEGWQYTSTNSPLYLGASSSSGNAALTGSLDDLRIYPYALSQRQIKQIMNNGAVSIG